MKPRFRGGNTEDRALWLRCLERGASIEAADDALLAFQIRDGCFDGEAYVWLPDGVTNTGVVVQVNVAVQVERKLTEEEIAATIERMTTKLLRELRGKPGELSNE